MSTICFFHSADIDGQMSGAIVARYYNWDLELYGINYGDHFPWEKVKGADVVMVDFSLPIEEMIRVGEVANSFTWIDHHSTAIKDWQNYLNKTGVYALPVFDYLSTDKAACQLTWEFFNAEEEPEAVYLAGKYDIWQWQGIPGAVDFQFGLRLQDTHPKNREFWETLLAPGHTDLLEEIINNGEVVRRYQDLQNDKYSRATSFTLDWEGLRFIASNAMLTNSQLFDSVFDRDIHDAMLVFGFMRGDWICSMYSYEDICDARGFHLGKIAKKYGGGGHKGAAGFHVSTLPFELPEGGQ